MTSIPLDIARQDLDGLLSRVIASPEPVVVNAPSGDGVVMLPLAEFSAWEETAYLLSNPANARHLRRSIDEARAGQVSPRELDEA